MTKFPVDASVNKVIIAFENLRFRLVRKANHIAMIRENKERVGRSRVCSGACEESPGSAGQGAG